MLSLIDTDTNTCSDLNTIALSYTPESLRSNIKTYADLNTISFPKTDSTMS